MEHRGKRILYVDYRGMKPKDILPLMKETNDAVAASRGRVMILGNVKGAVVTREVMDYLKKSARMVLRNRAEKIAVVGATALLAVFFDSFVVALERDSARKFATEEEALKWLSE
jgi:predicted aconitase with swiveling domain